MKKRHQQKLVILSIGLLLFLNLPIIMIANQEIDIFGVPLLYAYLFCIWLVSIVITYTIIKKYA